MLSLKRTNTLVREMVGDAESTKLARNWECRILISYRKRPEDAKRPKDARPNKTNVGKLSMFAG